MKPSPEEEAKQKAEEAKSDVGKEFTIDEISKHASSSDCWLVRRYCDLHCSVLEKHYATHRSSTITFTMSRAC